MIIHQFNRTRRGFALTEVLLAIAVIVIVGIAAYPLYKNARVNSEVETLTNKINLLDADITKNFASQSDYSQVTTANLIAMGLITDANSDGTITNQWGGVLSVMPLNLSVDSGAPTTSNNFYMFQASNVPKEVCIKFLSKLSGNYEYIRVGSTAGGVGTDVKTPIVTYSLSNLTTACSVNDTVNIKIAKR